jgi:hypothetical protein
MSTTSAPGHDPVHIPVHPAAELYSVLGRDDLLRLGEDIKANGLRQPVVMFKESTKSTTAVLLDGRNRIAAMELVGIEVVDRHGKLTVAHEYRYGKVESPTTGQLDPLVVNPWTFALSQNAHRRHLTKAQLAKALIDAVAGAEAWQKDHATVARSFSPTPGKRGGSTKGTVGKAVELAAETGVDVSPRTIATEVAKKAGRAPAPRKLAVVKPPVAPTTAERNAQAQRELSEARDASVAEEAAWRDWLARLRPLIDEGNDIKRRSTLSAGMVSGFSLQARQLCDSIAIQWPT